MPRIVAVLDTMWGTTPGKAVRFFRIDPENHSGRRLYQLVGAGANLRVTNVCKYMTDHATKHGKPDAFWLLEENLRKLEPIDVILVCGKVASKTYESCGYVELTTTQVFRIPHPAARNWTKALIKSVAGKIQKAIKQEKVTREIQQS